MNPREVEAVILQIEGVREAKVYGEPAGARGEVVAAAIVATPDVTREQVREFCRARLSLHKVPRIVKLIEAIPVDERGKVKIQRVAGAPGGSWPTTPTARQATSQKTRSEVPATPPRKPRGARRASGPGCRAPVLIDVLAAVWRWAAGRILHPQTRARRETSRRS